MSKFAVCPDCGGSGYSDSLGDVTEMIHEDPDFAEDYRAGHYNEGCRRCRGRNVVLACKAPGCDEPAEEGTNYTDGDDDGVSFSACYEHLTDDERNQIDEDAQIDAMCEAERRMGA
jgi:hypothetical protein